MEKINKGIEEFFRNLPPQKLKELKAFNLFRNMILSRFKEEISVESIKDGVIFVKLSSPLLRNEIEFIKSEIVEKINKKVGENFIREIKIRIS